MINSFDVVEIGPEQWADVRALRLEMLADTPTAFVERLEDARALSDDEWRERADRGTRPGHCGVVAVNRESGHWLGTMRGAVLADGRPFLVGVYVRPAFRGHRVADALLDAVENWARSEGAETLYLQVHEDNSRAQAFYRRRGWEPTGTLEPYPLDPTRNEIEMAYDLRG